MARIYTGVEFSNTPENIRSLMSRIIPVINLAHKANLDRILYWLGLSC